MKKIILFAMLISLALIGISCVSAADMDNSTITDAQIHPICFPDAIDSHNSTEIIEDSNMNSDENPNNQTPGSFDDLQAEIDNAADGSILVLTRDYYGTENSFVQLDKNLIIDGQGHTIDCLNKDGCSAFYSSKGDITIKNLRIINANNDYNGGAIYITDDAKYTISNCTFENNRAEKKGGAVYSENSLDIENSTFISNSADNGGAVYVERGLNAVNVDFTQNSANDYGGAFYSDRDSYISQCLFESNRVTSDYGYGGAIYVDNAEISNSTFKKNYAKASGGAVYAFGLTLLGSNSFEDNTAGKHGGAIYTSIFTDDVKYAKFINNTAENGYGGAIHIYSENKVAFSQCIFVNNHCGQGGGVIYLESSRSHLTLENNFFNGNSAGKKGQAVFNYGYYDSVDSNCWSEKNPSSGNDILTAAHLSGPNDYISDSNPLEMVLFVNSQIKLVFHMVDDVAHITACFINNAGDIFEGEFFDLSNINLYPGINIDFSNEKISPCNISVDATIKSFGIHEVLAEFYGYTTLTLLVSGE
ncbi:right-handed parallel beta-helix repeat-containing protein [Methanobrevibacter sp.]|uniref:right-handed parallel beta-helix repeat-containing protein n=1 Tax=Methanobrevibacter sp. TaxID=66852 RepID=UPI00388E1946